MTEHSPDEKSGWSLLPLLLWRRAAVGARAARLRQGEGGAGQDPADCSSDTTARRAPAAGGGRSPVVTALLLLRPLLLLLPG